MKLYLYPKQFLDRKASSVSRKVLARRTRGIVYSLDGHFAQIFTHLDDIMLSKEVIRNCARHYNGCLPIYKPKGIDFRAIQDTIKWDFEHTLKMNGATHSYIDLRVAKALEPFASGLITLVFGTYRRWLRNFVFADSRYRIKVELGVERQFASIDGDVISRSNINHITSHMIESSFAPFLGLVDYTKTSRCYSKPTLPNNSSQYDQMYHHITTQAVINKPLSRDQKYPLAQRPISGFCESIKLIDYTSPFATFDIIANGSFRPRPFILHLAEQIDTQASVVEMTRYQEGPITLDDLMVVQPHELQLELYFDRLMALKSTYSQYLAQFDDRFEKAYESHQVW